MFCSSPCVLHYCFQGFFNFSFFLESMVIFSHMLVIHDVDLLVVLYEPKLFCSCLVVTFHTNYRSCVSFTAIHTSYISCVSFSYEERFIRYFLFPMNWIVLYVQDLLCTNYLLDLLGIIYRPQARETMRLGTL